MQQPMISVIIPVYNMEKYLLRCVGSILGQTYKNIEVIIVDDGSVDSTPQICDHIAFMSEIVRVIHQENRGLSGARNTGMRASTGDYIHFCDADDFLEKDTYETIMTEMLREDADVAYFGWSRDYWYSAVSQADNAKRGVGNQFDLGYSMLIQGGAVGGKKGYGNFVCNKIFRTSVLKDKENEEWILFDETVIAAEDGLWLVDVLPNLQKGVFFPKAYYHYFRNQNGITGNQKRRTEVSLASQQSHIRMLEKLKTIDMELYKVHQETCNGFFWIHVPKKGTIDDVLLEGTIRNLYQVYEGKFPPRLMKILKDYQWLRGQEQFYSRYMERPEVKLVVRIGNLLHKWKCAICKR